MELHKNHIQTLTNQKLIPKKGEQLEEYFERVKDTYPNAGMVADMDCYLPWVKIESLKEGDYIPTARGGYRDLYTEFEFYYRPTKEFAEYEKKVGYNPTGIKV